MKKHKYKVEFYYGSPEHGPYVYVTAQNRNDAKILAQAERIKNGLDTRVESILQIPRS